MTRSSIRQAIDFQGIIEGCPDHQWLLTDALYETAEGTKPPSSPRWIVLSHVPPSPSSNAASSQTHYEVRDQEKGWTLSAPSAAALAKQIRQRCASSGRTQA